MKQERVLRREIATMTELRSPWGGGVVSSGLTPRRLAVLLQQAADGDLQAYLTLAEEMEERDPHYALRVNWPLACKYCQQERVN